MSGIIGGAGSKSGVIGTTELDYEEGTWTPTDSQGAFSWNGQYTKIGGIVTIRAHGTNGGTSAGTITFAGLPFPADSAHGMSFLEVYQVNKPSGYQLIAYVSSSSFNFRWISDTGTGAAATGADFTHASSTVGISGSYQSA
tara:strand:+ start:364 stop:786 length:423 start_codon:yes stop_codon:yes gene_type:complete